MKHISVLLEEAVNALNLDENSIVVDATLGYAGHSSEILKRIKRVRLFAFDQDSEAIKYSTDRLIRAMAIKIGGMAARLSQILMTMVSIT